MATEKISIIVKIEVENTGLLFLNADDIEALLNDDISTAIKFTVTKDEGYEFGYKAGFTDGKYLKVEK